MFIGSDLIGRMVSIYLRYVEILTAGVTAGGSNPMFVTDSQSIVAWSACRFSYPADGSG